MCYSAGWSRLGRKKIFIIFSTLLISSFTLAYLLFYNTAYLEKVSNKNKHEFRIQNVKGKVDILGNDNSWETEETPVLTLFTSWVHRRDKYVVQNRKIKNWIYLWPHIHPVIFTNDKELGDICRRQGWSILPLKHTALEGVPVVKYMYLDAMRRFNSTFYGFANADILFNDGLLNTIFTIRKFIEVYRDPVLITGIRTNLDYKIPCNETDMRNISKVSKTGQLAHYMSADYFITTRDYPWQKMEEIVIGRNQVDNWIIQFSQMEKIFVINSTPTVIALHQTTETGNFESSSKQNKLYNSVLIRQVRNIPINVHKARVECAEFVTNVTKYGHIQIMRQPLPKQC